MTKEDGKHGECNHSIDEIEALSERFRSGEGAIHPVLRSWSLGLLNSALAARARASEELIASRGEKELSVVQAAKFLNMGTTQFKQLIKRRSAGDLDAAPAWHVKNPNAKQSPKWFPERELVAFKIKRKKNSGR